jgi:hypothetical protein
MAYVGLSVRFAAELASARKSKPESDRLLEADVASRLNAAANAFLDKAETRQRLGAIGYRVFGGPPERLRDRMSADRAK